MNFKETLVCLMQTQGKTVYQLAKDSGVSETAIHAYRKGTSQPTLDKADRILKALGASMTIGKA